MSTLYKTALSAILRLTQPSSHTSELADLTAAGVEYSQPVLSGSSPKQELALVLAVAFAESRFREDVVKCRKRGDRHISPVGSISAYQLLGPWARQGYEPHEICSDHVLATQLAMDVLRAKHLKCRGTIRSMLSAYNTGHCDRNTVMVQQACSALDRMNLGIRCSDKFVDKPQS